MSRTEHEFEFTAACIADAANVEASYHEERTRHWQNRRDGALDRVEETIGAKVVAHEVTGGKRASVVVDYGDIDAWREYELAYDKVNTHREMADRYRTDEKLYGTQGARLYALDAQDVHHFRLGGQERPS